MIKYSKIGSTSHGLKALQNRYYQKGETEPEMMWDRISNFAALDNNAYGRGKIEQKQAFYEIHEKQLFTGAGRQLCNCGGDGNGNPGNCFGVPIDDSMDSIMEALKRFVEIARKGGGIGINFSRLRPTGDYVEGAKSIASGPCSFIDMFQTAAVTIKQGGNASVADVIREKKGRGLAAWAGLDISHPDIREFIHRKETPGIWRNFNVSVVIPDSFMGAVQTDSSWNLMFNNKIYEKVNARELWDEICECSHNSGEPGVIFSDSLKNNPISYVVDLDTVNPCVSGDTSIMTNIGYRNIKDCVGEKVNIWNGQEFSEVIPEVTGENQDILDITFSDGSNLKCTPYHSFFVIPNGKYARSKPIQIIAQDLKIGTRLEKYGFPIIGGSVEISEKEIYTRGFFSGDGSRERTRDRQSIYLYDKKLSLTPFLLYEKEHPYPHANKNWLKLYRCTWEKDWVPDAGYTVQTRLDWLAGLLDSDGGHMGNGGYSITSINKDFLLKVKKMLATLGVGSVVGFMKEATEKLMPDGKGGLKKYKCKEAWRITINGSRMVELVKIGLHTHRVDISYTPTRSATQFVRITKIVKLEEKAEKVYCFAESKRHRGMFNGVVTGQCGELPSITQSIDGKEQAGMCCLGSLILPNFYDSDNHYIDSELLIKTIQTAVLYLDNLITVGEYPLPLNKETMEEFRPIGLGVLGLADLLFLMELPYGDYPETIEFVDEIMSFINTVARDASQKLAKTLGAFPAYDREKDKQPPRRNSTLIACAPTGTISAIYGASWGIEPYYAVSMRRNEEMGTSTTGHTVLDNWRKNHPDENWPSHLRVVHNGGQNIQELTVDDHLVILSTIARHVDNAVSKTINMPKNSTVKDVSNAYKYMWKHGIKGGTVFREGCREENAIEVIQTDMDKYSDGDLNEDKDWEYPDEIEFINLIAQPRSIPDEVEACRYRLKYNPRKPSLYIHITDDDDGPLEVFFSTLDAQNQETLDGLALTMTSLFRRGIDCYHLLDKWGRYESANGGSWYDGKYVPSMLAGVAMVITKHFKKMGYIAETEKDIELEEIIDESKDNKIHGERCPECGMFTLIRGTGCPTCMSCGFSLC